MLVKRIGQREFTEVFIGVDSTDFLKKELIIKKVQRLAVERHQKIRAEFNKEVSLMKTLNHPNLMRIEDFLATPNNLYLVMRLCNNGDLESMINKCGYLSEEKAVYFLRQMMDGLCELHKRKIIHRDLRAANIFINDYTVIIGEFGHAKAGIEATRSVIGNRSYMAPEMLFSKGEFEYTNKVDLWSIGVIFYQMLTGCLPFKSNNEQEFEWRIINESGANLRLPPNVYVSCETFHLLSGLLQLHPHARISWNDFLSHIVFEKFKNYIPEESIVIQEHCFPQILHSTIMQANQNNHEQRYEIDRSASLEANQELDCSNQRLLKGTFPITSITNADLAIPAPFFELLQLLERGVKGTLEPLLHAGNQQVHPPARHLDEVQIANGAPRPRQTPPAPLDRDHAQRTCPLQDQLRLVVH
jgi:serine/threonine protein kinase